MLRTKAPTDEQLMAIFKKIVTSNEESKAMLKNPAAVLSENGIAISDPDFFDAFYFDAAPNLKRHFLAGSVGKPDLEGIALCESPRHIAKRALCITKIGITASTLITLILTEGEDPSPSDLQALASLVKVSVATLEGIFKHTRDPVKIVGEICSALGD